MIIHCQVLLYIFGLIFPISLLKLPQKTMESCPFDWDEAFLSLSREIFAPELTAVEPHQQNLTPPVRFHPPRYHPGINFTFASFPSPQASDTHSLVEQDTTVISVSTTFFPGAELGQPCPPDLILYSSDSVFFYVHSSVLVKFSKNSFNSLLPSYPVSPTSDDGAHLTITVQEDSHVLNIILRLFYMIPCVNLCPSVDVISKVISSLKRHGVTIKSFAAVDTCLYDLILSRAPLHPIELYSIAAENGLDELAVAVSPHLMSFNLATLTDRMATQMGPSYLRRLFFLHLGRNEALKRLLFTPPVLHGPSPQCDFTEQRKLTRAWALAAAYLAWDGRPGLLLHPNVVQLEAESPDRLFWQIFLHSPSTRSSVRCMST